MKTIPALLKKAQDVFNRFIRERDKNKPCITCTEGITQEAGHFIPVGRSSYTRFMELNVWGQCHECNCYKGGNEEKYREALVKRIGEDAVLKLEQDARLVKKWDRGELLNIISTYKI